MIKITFEQRRQFRYSTDESNYTNEVVTMHVDHLGMAADIINAMAKNINEVEICVTLKDNNKDGDPDEA